MHYLSSPLSLLSKILMKNRKEIKEKNKTNFTFGEQIEIKKLR